MAQYSTKVCSRRLMARAFAERQMTAVCMISTFLGSGIVFLFFGGCASAPTSSSIAFNDEGVAPLEVEVAALPTTDTLAQAQFAGPMDEGIAIAPNTPKATVADLAATYEADLVALRSMQAVAPVTPTIPTRTSTIATETPTPTTVPSKIEWSDGTTGTAPDRMTSMRANAQRELLERATSAANALSSASTTTTQAQVETPTPTANEQTAANEPLSAELPTASVAVPLPTDAAGLALRLATTLTSDASKSATPMRQLLALSALAVTDPTIALPKDLATHLTDEERATAEKFHAAFVRIGRDLQDAKDDAALVSAVEQLLAALKPAPMLALPRVEFCTRVQAFGQIDPIDNRRFLAATSPRVIVYSELENFVSAMADAKWTTRLATKISILTERDGVEVWRRSPEWTAVIDASDVKRNDFFVGEIVTLSPHLSVGSYVLKMTIRDEATATVAEKSVSFQVVADPTMVSTAG